MIGWIILAVYIVGYLLLWRTICWGIIKSAVYGKPTGEDVVLGALLGSLAALFWPLVLSGLVVRAIYRARDIDAAYALMPRAARREQVLRDRERKIERLERELGVGNGR